jgi:hypothetical protein
MQSVNRAPEFTERLGESVEEVEVACGVAAGTARRDPGVTRYEKRECDKEGKG